MAKVDELGTLKLDVLLGLMTELGYDQAELARRSGISESTISRLVSGKLRGDARHIGLLRAFPRLPFERLFVDGRSDEGAVA